MNEGISHLRTEYKLKTLDELNTQETAFAQFSQWWDEAVASNIAEVNAMTLATVNAALQPSARIVLLKDFSENGFTFYTNYHSRKGREIADNPNVSLVFFWKELERQVRIEGVATMTSPAESDAYFNSRPEGSKIGAWASPQSEVIESREVLEETESSLHASLEGKMITRPPHWGGYLVKPNVVEFWQGRPGRLHDRIRYQRRPGESPGVGAGRWSKDRLAP